MTGPDFRVGPPDGPDRIHLGPAVGSGSEGVLYRGALEVGPRSIDVAVKMLQPGHLDRLSAWVSRWREQVDLLRQAQIPGLVRVRGGFVGPLPHLAGQADLSTSSLYLLMDWVEGTSLDRWARSVDASRPEQLLLALVPVAAAMDLLHSGVATSGVPVIHRDIKPANILVRPDGTTVLVDIGSLRGLTKDATITGIIGTPGYIAPEALAEGLYGPPSDRYSLGAVGFYLLTGSDPRPGATFAELRERLVSAPSVRHRPELAEHVLAMLSPDPAARPTSLANWVAQLRRSSLPVLPGPVALPPTAPPRLGSPPRAGSLTPSIERLTKRRLWVRRAGVGGAVALAGSLASVGIAAALSYLSAAPSPQAPKRASAVAPITAPTTELPPVTAPPTTLRRTTTTTRPTTSTTKVVPRTTTTTAATGCQRVRMPANDTEVAVGDSLQYVRDYLGFTNVYGPYWQSAGGNGEYDEVELSTGPSPAVTRIVHIGAESRCLS
jgi:serine/threonine protein kinase